MESEQYSRRSLALLDFSRIVLVHNRALTEIVSSPFYNCFSCFLCCSLVIHYTLPHLRIVRPRTIFVPLRLECGGHLLNVGAEVPPGFPCVVFGGKIFPMDVVLVAPSVFSIAGNCFNLVLFVVQNRSSW